MPISQQNSCSGTGQSCTKCLTYDFINRKSALQGQWKVRNKEGHTFMILSNAAYLTNQDTGEPQKMTFVVNITDAQHAHEELQATVAVLQKKLPTQDTAVNMANSVALL